MLAYVWEGSGRKLDGVGPVDNRPSTDQLHHFVNLFNILKKYFDMWLVTGDMWHLTRDMWHVTRDMFAGGWTFSQNFSSLALTVYDLWYYEDLEERMTDSVNELMTRLFIEQPRLHRVC